MAIENQSIVLASSSPRRQAFLRALGLRFHVEVADVDETPAPGEEPVALAARLAVEKAEAVAARRAAIAPAHIIAGDTVVALGNLLLGKPVDAMEATAMLKLLRNRVHQVHSAVCLLDTQAHCHTVRVSTTNVWMRAYTDREIEAYVATGDPLDKAGAYAIQHPTFAPVAHIEGCLSGVIGLPLGVLGELLMEQGVDLPEVAPICMRQTDFLCCQAANGSTGLSS